MLEGSFRPPSAPSASGHLHHYSHPAPPAAHSADPPAPSAFRRKDLPPPPPSRAPSFTPITLHQHSPSYDPEEHTSPSSPPQIFHHPQAHRPSQPTPALTSSFRSTDPASLLQKPDLKPAEAIAKDPSFGPVRAKKKPAGSACNSCHRLKTRCSGGYPCDRCAAHKVPCQFDRDLIYRSPLASSSQQASARNAQVLNTVNRKPLDSGVAASKPPRARSTNASSGSTKSTCKRPTAPPPPPPVQQQQGPQKPPLMPIPAVPTHVEAVAQLPRSTPSPIPLPARPAQQVLSHPSSALRKPAPTKSAIPPAPNPSEAFVTCDPNLSAAAFSHSVNLRLSALENNLSSVLQILRPQASLAHSRLTMPDQARVPSPIPAPPMLLASSSTGIGPERDRRNDTNRLGLGPGNGDLLTDALLDSTQIQYLFDVFVDYCLPSLPILHRVQLSMIRVRSPFLFSTMLAIGARFCSTQSVAQPSSNLLSATPNSIAAHPNTRHISEPAYARLVSLAYQHLSSTLLKSCHSLDDVRAILFLSSWSLISNEDGPPNRWVLVGHAARIGRSMGLERLARDLSSSDGWANAEQHSLKRDQLDALKTDYAMCSLEAFLSTTLRLEPTRDYFPRPPSPAGSTKPNIVQLATGSPFQYDIVSTAQIQAMAELADIWTDASSFLTSADDRNRKLSAEQLADLGERHNTSLDVWAKKWTWHGSSWAPLLGNYLRTVRLLSESLRITLNLALTNVLHASIMSSAGSAVAARFQETLSIALERVNGASTAVIQAHRDSAREGFSLAFAPDLITDGLVSAALTVLQLASPFVHSGGRGPVPASGGQLLPEEERSTTPSEKGDMEMSDVTTTTHKSSSIHPQPTTANSSPAATPDAEHSNSGESLGKKPLMEPAVAAHYIRMAADALKASDRSQTRLGTNMACKIISLAERAGLLPRVAGASSQPVKTVASQKAEERRRSEASVGGRIPTSLPDGDDEASVNGGRRASSSSEKMGEDDDEAEDVEEEEEEEIDGEEGEEDAENLSVRTENAENVMIEDEADYLTGGKVEDDDAFKYINEHYDMEFEDHK